MRLLKPSPGECADRQTILNLKAKAGEEKTPPLPVHHWVDENEQLQLYLEKNWFPDFPRIGDQYDELFDQLAETNKKLWGLEDEARALRDAEKTAATMYRAGVVMFEITENNDQRMRLVLAINQLFAVAVQEKIYA